MQKQRIYIIVKPESMTSVKAVEESKGKNLLTFHCSFPGSFLFTSHLNDNVSQPRLLSQKDTNDLPTLLYLGDMS